MKRKWKIYDIIIILILGFLIYWLFIRGHDWCPEYYEKYKKEFIGIVSRKWRNKGTNMKIDFLNRYGGVQLRDGFSPELVKNSEVDDTVIKKAGTMLCTLKSKKGTLILPYEYLPSGVHCPDTNKLK
jgi:hypothetical protein